LGGIRAGASPCIRVELARALRPGLQIRIHSAGGPAGPCLSLQVLAYAALPRYAFRDPWLLRNPLRNAWLLV
jgi:hypothetical protein